MIFIRNLRIETFKEGAQTEIYYRKEMTTKKKTKQNKRYSSVQSINPGQSKHRERPCQGD